MQIELEFHCTATDGKCAWNKPVCIEMDSVEQEGWTCPYLEAKRKSAEKRDLKEENKTIDKEAAELREELKGFLTEDAEP